LPLQRLKFSDLINSSRAQSFELFFETAVLVSCRRSSNLRRPFTFVPGDQNQFEKIPCEDDFSKIFFVEFFWQTTGCALKKLFFFCRRLVVH
jgi:hypothetical protein